MREKFDKLISSRAGKKITRFCNSVWYVAAFGSVCAMSHATDTIVPAIIVLSIMVAGALVFSKSLLFMIPFLMMCMFPIARNTLSINIGHIESISNLFSALPTAILVSGAFAIVILLFSLVFNMVYYGNYRRIFRRGYFSISMCLITAALLLGGVGSKYFAGISMLTAFGVGFAFFVPYSMVINCIDYDREKTTEYVAWTIIIAALVVCAAIYKAYCMNGFSLDNPKRFLNFGYGNCNSVATFIVMAIPATFYFVCKYKRGYLFLLLVAFEVAAVLFTFSRGALVAAGAIGVIAAVWTCFKKPTGRKSYYICLGAFAAMFFVLFMVTKDRLFGSYTIINENGEIMSSGRFGLWKQGFDYWKHNVIFGLGFDFLPQVNGVTYSSFHNTLFTYLYCGGLLGFLAYAYHRYLSVRAVFSAKLTQERVFDAFIILALLINSLLDVAMTSPMHIFYYSIALALIELDTQRSRKDAGKPSLVKPLFKKTPAPAAEPEPEPEPEPAD